MIEEYPSTNSSFEISREEDGPFSIYDMLGVISEEGVYVHRLTEEQISTISPLVRPRSTTRRDSAWKIEQGEDFDQQDLQDIWKTIAPREKNIEVVFPRVNYYSPQDVIPYHHDIGDPIEPEDLNLFESKLVFIYTVAGSKDILLYTNGPDNKPARLTQEPGLLLVIPMEDVKNPKGEVIAPAIYHEVEAQDATCTTLTWEIKRNPIIHQ